MTDTFWTRMAYDGASAIGKAGVDPRPYARLSEGSTVMAQKVLDDAASIFPEFDGVTTVALPLPADFTNPPFASFLNWHTAHQVKFLKESAPNWAVGDLRAVTFGTSANPIENETFMLSADGRRVIHVNQLQTTDIAALPLADQERLAELPAFRALHSNPLGLWPADDVSGNAPPATVAEARARVESAYIKPLEDLIKASAAYSDAKRGETVTTANMTTHYPNLFLDQVDLIRRRLAGMAVFSPDALGEWVRDIKTRFDRVEAYSNVTKPEKNVLGLTLAANSTDDLAGVERARTIFLQTELRLRDLAVSSYDIADDGKYTVVVDGQAVDRFTDTPLMVFLFQTQANYAAEADAQARSEELRQMNALIQTYTQIQKYVNETLKKFDPVAFQAANPNDDKAIERKAFLGISLLGDLGFSESDMKLLSMFEKTVMSQKDNTYLPIEKSTNALRPSFDFLDGTVPFLPTLLKTHTQQEWDLFSQSLSKVSKVLSSDSQARMDSVNKISREKNRHYELASETLNKMTDILRSIVN